MHQPLLLDFIGERSFSVIRWLFSQAEKLPGQGANCDQSGQILCLLLLEHTIDPKPWAEGWSESLLLAYRSFLVLSL